jgi:predicted GNAT superfamily acetyltransferase
VTAPTDAWTLAHEAAARAGVALRPLTSVEDAHRLNDVIVATWGDQTLDHEVVRALAVSGNVPWGAEADGALVGFVLGFAGIDEDGLHVHSHMLASIPDRRHAGVGLALKLAQRAQALEQGIEVMRWTFDPMVARNAWFNLGKLGAVIDRFERDFYGVMEDRINAGDRSDRFTVRWDLTRAPGPWAVHAGHRVPVPAEYHDLRLHDPEAAADAREEVAEAARTYLDDGMLGAAFDREASAYVFARPEDLT